MAKDKNNGIVNTGTGTVVATDVVMGDADGTNTSSGTNNGVINTGSGAVVINGAVMGSGNTVSR